MKTTANTKAIGKTNWKLARRDLLKGLGVGLACLPMLRAERARAAGANKRLIMIQMSEGLRQGSWKPAVGPLTKLPLTNTPFEPHKNEMIFLPNLSNPGIGAGGHGSYGVIYYGLGATGGGQYKEPTGKTIDQVIADGLPMPASGRSSLNLQVQLYIGRISTTSPGGGHSFWRGAGQPINPLADPYALYNEIFAGGAMATPGAPPMDDAAVTRLMTKRKSILDYVGKSLEDFKSRVGTDDREAIGAHFQSIRDLETQLQSAGTVSAKCGGSPPAMIDVTDPAKYPDILKAHSMLMVDALKCGVTNVTTLQTGDSSGNNINFHFVPGIPAMSKNNYKTPFRNWHDLGHNPVMDGVDHKQIVDQWFMAQWADLFTAMKAVPEDGGTLFDNTLVVIGNHMQEGQNHDAQNNPWMLAGNVGKYFNGGQCLPSDGKPVKSVMASMCEAFGVPGTAYGAPLPGLKKA